MRVLFGICGEGRGHATRSKVSIGHLRGRGHRVLVAAPGSAFSFFEDDPDAVETAASRMETRDGAFDVRRTLETGLRRLPAMLARNADVWRALEALAPEAVVSDYSTFAWLFARAHDLPCLSIDNSHASWRCALDPRVLGEDQAGVEALARQAELTAPTCDRYVITSFCRLPVRPEHARTTAIVPPILRPEILAARPSAANLGHLLVYATTSLDARELLAALAAVPERRFVVYGAKDGAASTPPNVRLRPPSEAGMVRDIAGAAGVISNGGMSLTGEALYLGKPVLAVPVRGQFEQAMNARHLVAAGVGHRAEKLGPETIRDFARDLPRLAGRARALSRTYDEDHHRLYAELDAFVRYAEGRGRMRP